MDPYNFKYQIQFKINYSKNVISELTDFTELTISINKLAKIYFNLENIFCEWISESEKLMIENNDVIY